MEKRKTFFLKSEKSKTLWQKELGEEKRKNEWKKKTSGNKNWWKKEKNWLNKMKTSEKRRQTC